MKKLTALFATAIAAMLPALGTQSANAATDAADQPLIMTIKSNIYGYQGPDNNFTFYLGSTEKDVEFYVVGPKTTEYIYVDPYSLGTGSDGDKTAIATAVTCSVTESDNSIKIYGDATKLDYIDMHGCYLNSLDLSGDFINLSVIDLSHNELTEIDLSRFTSLNSIDLLDNAFSVPEKMKIGTNHPDLIILSVGINDVVDPELDLKNFPNLMYFSARNNYGVTHVDPTNCPELVSLVLEVTNVSTIDVSKNHYLDVLNLSNTRVTEIDLSKNVNLGELYMNHDGSYNSTEQYKLRSIDVSKNTKLQYLDLGGNLLTDIDLTNNPDLILLFLMRNRLTQIDLSNCTRLAKVDLSNNYFDFATLPLPGYGWDYYYYQRPLSTALKYKTGEPIDFSSRVNRAPYVDSEGNTITPATFAAVFVTPRAAQEYELDESKYTYDNGVLTFNEAIPDSVHVRFHCTAFDDWDLQSSSFMVKTPEEFDLPSTAFTFTPAASMAGQTVAFKLGGQPFAEGYSLPQNVTVLVAGDKIELENALVSSSLPANDNISFTMPSAGGEVTIALPDGFMATALEMDGVALSDIDLSPAENLVTLTVKNAGLQNIDLAYNYALRKLDVSGNALTRLALEGVRGDYEKWNLAEINASENKLKSLSLISYETLRTLNLSGNEFTVFDTKYYNGLTSLDLSFNQLSGEFDLSKVETLTSLNLSNNKITSVLISSWSGIRNLNLSYNNLTFATLPLVTGNVNYSYAPQGLMQILTAAAAINLSAQNVMLNGAGGTSYVWKYANTDQIVPSNLYTETDGAFKFDADLLGSAIYCEMTNPLFPDFDSEPLTTTPTTVAEKPTTLVASFTTAQSGTAEIGFRFNTPGDNAVYIDWRGDGSEYEPYIYEANAAGSIYREGKCFAGKTAKVYTFGSASDISVFAMNNTPLSMFDGTPMVKIEAIDIHNAGLKDGKIQLPDTKTLSELVLDGNSFSKESFAAYTNLRNLNLAANNYTSFDFSPYKNLMFAQLSGNKIANVTFGNNTSLYQLDLQMNKLSDIDLTGLKNLQELLLSDNLLTSVDFTPVKDILRVLWIAGNNFTFETLPLPTDFNINFTAYDYSNQKPLLVSAVDGNKIDLSSQSEVAGTPTEYLWFLGDRQTDVYYDYYYEMFIGEELEGPDVSDDPEYMIENGVTTFLYPQNRKVICAMTNSQLPSLILYTQPAAISVSGVDTINPEDAFGDVVDIYNLSGVLVRSQVKASEAVNDLSPGLYVIGGKKVLVK